MAPIPVFLGALVGDSNRSTDGCRTATEARMKMARFDEKVRETSLAMQHWLDAIVYAMVAPKLPDIFGVGFVADQVAQINRKLRKRHARYRRGRESVRPRMRCRR